MPAILLEAWLQRHVGLKTQDLPKVSAAADLVSECHQAGFCVCSDQMQEFRMLVARFQAAISNLRDGLLKPKTAGRSLYDSAMVRLLGGACEYRPHQSPAAKGHGLDLVPAGTGSRSRSRGGSFRP